MPDDTLEQARGRLKQVFRWLDGHADVDGLFRDPELVQLMGPALAEPFRDQGITAVVGVEAIGFIPASLVASSLRVGLVLVRAHARPGGEKVANRTAPDWRGREVPLELHRDHISGSDRVLIVDEWVETGNHALAAWRLIEACGALPVGVAAIVDDVSDNELRRRLRLQGLVRAAELPAARLR
jgi:adenine phosphoribosyltransferase